MKRILIFTLAMMLVSTLFFCSCDKAKKNEMDPHKLSGKIYTGTLY